MIGTNGKNNRMSNNPILFLVGSEYPISQLIEQTKNETNFKIISFDIDTHKKLLSIGLEHEISDNYLSETDIEQIQHTVYHFGKWYEDSNIKEYFIYENVNTAQLFHEQFNFLSPFVKTLYEIANITKKFPTSNFFASSQKFQFLKIFSDRGVEIKNDERTDLEFPHDKVRYNLKIGNRYFLFLIPRKYYLGIKKISEYFLNAFFSFNKNIPKTKDITLLVEFHTIRFKQLFLQSKGKSQLVSYSRRRPSIWNSESLSIFRRSNTKIMNSYLLNKSESKFTSRKLEFINKFNNFWRDDFPNEYFSIDGKSFWHILKPILYDMLSSRLDEAITEIELVRNMFNTYRIKSVVILSEVGMTEIIVSSIAKSCGVPISLLQVGYHWDTPEANELNVAQTVYPARSDKFLVWGKISEKDAIVNGAMEPNNVVVIGSPMFDGLFKTNNLSEDYVLFAVTGPRYSVRDLKVETYLNHENAIQEICKTVSKLGKKLIIKLHPGPSEENISRMVKKINPDFEVITSGDIFPLIKSCSVMITTRLSTAIVEAQIIEKPVIYVPIFDERYGTPEMFKSNSCVISSINSFESDLKKILNDTSFRQKIIGLANDFIQNYLTNQNKASKELLKFLHKV